MGPASRGQSASGSPTKSGDRGRNGLVRSRTKSHEPASITRRRSGRRAERSSDERSTARGTDQLAKIGRSGRVELDRYCSSPCPLDDAPTPSAMVARGGDVAFVRGPMRFRSRPHQPLPAAVTLDWLGFPEADWPRLAGPFTTSSPRWPAASGRCRCRRPGVHGPAHPRTDPRSPGRPRADAVSEIVAGAHVDGSAFSEDELVSVIGLLIAGGVERRRAHG